MRRPHDTPDRRPPAAGRRPPAAALLPLLPLLLLAACEPNGREPNGREPTATLAPRAHSFAHSEWSEPVNLGPPINTPVVDANAVLSKDGLGLYFDSDRTDIDPVRRRVARALRRRPPPLLRQPCSARGLPSESGSAGPDPAVR